MADHTADVGPELRYSRHGDVVRYTSRHMTNHELRCLIVGIWLRLDEDDRVDLISELKHYLDPLSVPPPVSRAIRDGTGRLA